MEVKGQSISCLSHDMIYDIIKQFWSKNTPLLHTNFGGKWRDLVSIHLDAAIVSLVYLLKELKVFACQSSSTYFYIFLN